MYTQPMNYYDWRIWYLPQPIHISTPPPMSFFARKAGPTANAIEESLLGFTTEELRRMDKHNEDDELDEDMYDMKKLGRCLKAGEYIIRVSLNKGDVRIVNTLSEKRKWDSESLAPISMVFKKYRAVLDPNGINARVELDPNALLVKKCPNCRKLIPLDDIDVAISNQAVFCSSKCRKEYAKRMQLKEEELVKVRQEISQQTMDRIEEIKKVMRGEIA